MIKIAGAAHRSFDFPADLATTRAFFQDFGRILGYLPHIRLAKSFTANHFRMLYHTTELGIYDVQIYCDLEAQFGAGEDVLHIRPWAVISPVKPRATINSLTAQGRYVSKSIFRAAGRYTRIDYELKLRADLVKPFGLILVPDSILQCIAVSITRRRIHEIADGFVERAIREYRLAEARNPDPPTVSALAHSLTPAP
jgi:hypothetical protein